MSGSLTKTIICGSLFFTYVHGASASSADLTDLSLKELVSMEVFTSASLVPTQRNKAPGTVHTFQRSDFDRFGVRRLDDLLQFVPGIQLNQYRKRHRSVWSRGVLNRYNDKMVLLIDGVRVRHLYYDHFSLGDNLPLELVEKVEVILGPASSIYGANAFAGIISVTTRDFSDVPEFETGVEVADNQRGKLSALYNSENLQLFASHLEQQAPFREDRKSFIGGDVLQPLDEDYSHFNVKWRPTEALTLRLDYNRDETPFLNIPTTQDAYVDSDFLSVSAAYEKGDIESGRIESTLYYQQDNTREYELEQTTQVLGYEEFQNAIMAGLSTTVFKKYDNHTLAGGINISHEKAKRTDYTRTFHFADGFLNPPETGDLLSEPGISNTDYAAFIQDIWEINPELSLTISGRYDKFEQFGSYFNHRTALVYTPDEDQTWKLQYGTAIRTPGYREYLKVLEGTTFVPPQVEAEKITLAELGYTYQWEKTSLNLNMYHGYIDDFIQEQPTPDDADEYFANSDFTYKMQGVEALLKYRPTPLLNTQLGISYLETDTDDGALPYLASWTGSLQLDYRYLPDHILGASIVYAGKREDSNSYNDDADEFATVNLFGSGQISDQLNYRFGIDNLFDQKVMDPAADFGSRYNNQRSEREIWIGLTWSSDLL